MKNPYPILAFIALSFLTGCKTYQNIPLINLEIGMSKSEVIQVLGREPDNLIGAKQYADGIVEVLQYSRYSIVDSSLAERYWLYFLNNKLNQWGRPGDWEKEADRIYEIRYR